MCKSIYRRKKYNILVQNTKLNTENKYFEMSILVDLAIDMITTQIKYLFSLLRFFLLLICRV